MNRMRISNVLALAQWLEKNGREIVDIVPVQRRRKQKRLNMRSAIVQTDNSSRNSLGNDTVSSEEKKDQDTITS